MGTFIVGAIVFAGLGLAARYVYKSNKKGKCCGCSGCGNTSCGSRTEHKR